MDPENQQAVDEMLITLDGTENKSKLGANSLVSVSLAVARLAAKDQHASLYVYLNNLARNGGINALSAKMPTPIFNMINGGKHGTGNLDFQEFQVIPSLGRSYQDALSIGVEVYQHLGLLLSQRGAIHAVGDEGGFAPNLYTNQEAFKFIAEAARSTPFTPQQDFTYGLDIAADSIVKNGKFLIKDRPHDLTKEEFITYLEELFTEYPFSYLEDALTEDDFEGWKSLTEKFGTRAAVVGDDFLATNGARLAKAIDSKACTGILVKPNQVGTLTETLRVIKVAKEAGLKIIISHRLGETTDTFIADLAVAVGADYVKFGAPSRGERVAKYNRLLQIDHILTSSVR